MSSYVSTREGQQRARYGLGHGREGLPADDWRDLGRAQRRSDMEKHFAHHGNSSRSYQPRRTKYQDAGMSRERRLDISKVQSATRSALGPSFDPYSEDSHEPSRRRDHDYGRARGWTDGPSYSAAVPRDHHDEYNRLWHEDDKDRDADQYIADHHSNAPWRIHDRLDPRDHYRGEPSTHSHRPRTAVPLRRVDSAAIEPGVYDDTHRRPDRPSKFDWDNDSMCREPKRRGFLGLFNCA